MDILQLTHLFDEFATAIENQASVIAGYYRKLINEDVPEDVAGTLTVQFAEILHTASLNKISE